MEIVLKDADNVPPLLNDVKVEIESPEFINKLREFVTTKGQLLIQNGGKNTKKTAL